MRYNNVLVFIITLCFAFNVNAQQDGYQYLNKELHLKNDEMVNAILQDHKGYIWVATEYSGVRRFDGKNSIEFTIKNGLASNDVLCITENDNGDILFGTYDNGISIWNGKEFKHISIKEGLSSNSIYNLYKNPYTKEIWICAMGGEIQAFNNNYQLKKLHFPSKKNLCVLQTKKNEIWIGTSKDGLIKITPNERKTYTPENSNLKGASIYSLLECSNDDILIGTTTNGLYCYKKGDIKKIDMFLPEYFVSSLKVNPYNKNQILVSSSDKTFVLSNYKNNYVLKDVIDLVSRNVFVNNNKSYFISTENKGVVKKEYNAFKKENIPISNVEGVINSILIRNNYLYLNFDRTQIVKYSLETSTRQAIADREDIVTNICAIDNNLIVASAHSAVFNLNTAKKTKDNTIDFFTSRYNEEINQVLKDKDNNYWIACNNKGVYKIKDVKNVELYNANNQLPSNDVQSMHLDKNGTIWLGTMNDGLVKYENNQFKLFNTTNGLANDAIKCITSDDENNLFVGTNSGLSILHQNKFITISDSNGIISNDIVAVLVSKKGEVWLGTAKGISKIIFDENFNIKKIKNYGADNGFDNISISKDCIVEDDNGTIWVGTNNGLYKYLPEYDIPNTSSPHIVLNNIKLLYKNVDWTKFDQEVDTKSNLPLDLSLSYNLNHLTFNFQAITIDHVKYQYKLVGQDAEWSPLTESNEAIYSNIPPGHYSFLVRCKNSDGFYNKDMLMYSFTIRQPFWKTWWFLTFCTIVVVIGTRQFIKYRTAQLEKTNKILEEKVEERTEQLKESNGKLSYALKDIGDSINYAKYIQNSIKPLYTIDKIVPKSFLIYQPKDVVSGDFYWFEKKDEQLFFAIADCTGHGVPGAFMSMMGTTLLNEIFNVHQWKNASDILSKLNYLVKVTFKQHIIGSEIRDGMDIAFGMYNIQTQELHYAGANRPLWLIRDGEFVEYKPDKAAIGGLTSLNYEFKNTVIQLKKDDRIYASTDGYADQFGGPDGKKFMTKKLKDILIGFANKPMEVQQAELEQIYADWKGDMEQVDDVLLIGLEV